MAYQVIARKFRPQSFTDFIGQKHITQTLINALAGDRFPHAILLTGPRGTGKTTIARIVAKTLLCQQSKDSNPCNQCSSCQDINQGRHLDMIEIDGASNNGVDHIRELRETVGYMPSGLYKIYIIDEVHMLSISAFNALLKTLEEPPKHVIFIFATTEVQKIPATILSRCQRFDFRNHSLVDIKNHLENICSKENIDFDEKALWLLAKQARGSIRDSLTLLDQLVSFGGNRLELQAVLSVLGLTDRSLLLKALQAIGKSDEEMMFGVLQSFRQSGLDPILFTEGFLEVLRDCLLVKLNYHKRKDTAFSEDEAEELEKLCVALQVEQIHLLFDTTLSGLQRLNFSNDANLGLEMLLFKLLGLPLLKQDSNTRGVEKNSNTDASGLTQNSNINRPKEQTQTNRDVLKVEAKNKKVSPVRQVSGPKETAKNFSPSIPTKTVGKTWEEFVHAVKQSNGFLGALLEHTSLFKQNDEVIYLGLPEKMSFLLDKLNEPKNIERTENFLKNFWSEKRKIKISILDKNHLHENLSPKAMAEKVKKQKKKKEDDDIKTHPLMKVTEDVFKDRIKQVKVTENSKSKQ